MAKSPLSSKRPALGKLSQRGSEARVSVPATSTRSSCAALVPFAALPHYELFLDPSCKLFLARRTAARFERLEDIRTCFSDVEKLLASINRSRHVLLVDVRRGPGRNDPGFETAIEEQRGKLLLGFARNAALCATPAGRLHIQRYAKTDGREVFVSDDPKAVFAHLGLPNHAV